MDLFNFDNDDNDTNVIIKKVEASSNSNSLSSGFLCFREIKKLFRIIEIFFILMFLTWVYTRLPFAVRISGEYFRLLLGIIHSPIFIFLLCNFILLTLFFKHEDVHDLNHFTGENDFPPPPVEPVEPEEETVYEDKETILEVSKVVKVHRRSQSENFSRTEDDSGCGKKILRRSETEMGRRRVEEESHEVDELSNEEFQRAIEDFIAKQIKFRQQEKLAVVLHTTTTTSTITT